MTIWLAFVALVFGFVFLVAGGEALVRSAISLAVRTNIPPAVISLTIIAAGTSAPELFTSLTAALKGAPDLAAGNVIGSNIFNVLGILGISFALYAPSKVSHSMVFEWLVLMLASAMTFLFAYNGNISRIEGGAFLAVFVVTTFISIRRARRQGFQAEDDDGDEPIETLKNVYWDLIYLVVGLAALIGGSELALIGGVHIGEWAGLSQKVIGLTIISVGTGLPELATSAVAAFRGRSDIAIGNVLGSNLMNTLGVLGATAAVSPLAISPSLVKIDSLVFAATSLVILPILLNYRWALSRIVGILFLALYSVYVWGSFTDWAYI